MVVLDVDMALVGKVIMLIKNIDNITCITVVYKTPDLMEKVYSTLRYHYPTVKYIIIDNSEGDECTELIRSWLPKDPNLKLVELSENIGHGYGMHRGIEECETDYAFIFDSDIIFKNGGFIEDGLKLFDEDTYGVGWILRLDMDGRNVPKDYDGEVLLYLFDGFWFVNKSQYYKYHPLHKFGLPLFKAMVEIHNNGLSEKILKPLFNGNTNFYLNHVSGGTRKKYGDVEDLLEGFKGKKGDMSGQLD